MEGTVAVRGIASSGDGVASLDDGLTVFIPRSAPGDVLTLRAIRRKARMATAEIDTIVEPGPGRVEPPCPHYVVDRCGGCQLMHLDPATQRGVKAQIATDAMRRIAKVDVELPPMHPAPQQFGYRSKVTLTVRGNRLGYRRLHDPDAIFDVRQCLIAERTVQDLIDGMRTARRHLPPNATRVVLRRDRDGNRHVIVRTDAGGAWTGGQALHRTLHARGVSATVWWQPEGGAPRAVAGSDDPWPATVFEQVHPAMGDVVRSHAVEMAGDVANRLVWDLYAGVGETTAALVARGATVESVERDRRAVAEADRLGSAGARRHAGPAEELIGSLTAPHVVITNPPRTGMSAEVTAAIAASGAQRVVYVSCDPATLARDIARLSEGYAVSSVRTFDQFPQTAHLETVAVLERR